ncbi:MAG TPA: N-acetylmuramoyl-L-alanine amidase [Anaerolineae bacterium]|nr:N-acetylmuramoyl-L-alanine amidase [Anaerolineae bacterium]
MDKLGLHIIGGFSGNLRQPRVVKLVDASPKYMRQVRSQVGPACLIVVRWVEMDQPLADPVAAAGAWFKRREPALREMAAVDGAIAFESYNEIDDTMAAAYCAFEVERLRLMHGAGYRSVAGNFSVGQPHERLWSSTYRPLLQALGRGDFLGLHEYWEEGSELGDTWLCGRWNRCAELASVPIIVTEVGRGAGGWQASSNVELYLDELARYNAIMEANANVLGGTVFTVGGHGWEAYDVARIWPHVVGRYTEGAWVDPSNPVPRPEPQPEPQPQPEPEPQPEPSIPYHHTARAGAGGRHYTPRCIVVHGTGAARDMTLARWRAAAPSPSSAHDLIGRDGAITNCVPYELAAYHAAGAHLPRLAGHDADGTQPDANLVTIGVALECPAAPAPPAWPQAQLDAAVAHIRQLAAAFSIAREAIVRHDDVDPRATGDLRGLAWGSFLDRVFQVDATLAHTNRNAAWNAGGIPYNPDAAFPRYAREHDLGNPETPEFDVQWQGIWYRGQGFSKGIVYARIGEWDKCDHSPW